MQSSIGQVTLQFPLEVLESDGTTREPGTLDECLYAARKAAEGIADSAEAMIVKVEVIHYPSGSGEPDLYDANGRIIDHPLFSKENR